MHTFQAVQKSFDSTGLGPKLEPFNLKMLNTLFINSSAIILLLIYLFHEADSSQKYMESIYVVTAGSGLFLSYVSTFLLRDELFSFIDSVDERVNERLNNPSSKAMCIKTNQLIEKISKNGFLAIKYVIVPCFILPKAIISFFIYFTTDSGNDAFDLPIPMWIPYDWKNPTGYLVANAVIFLYYSIYPFQYIGCIVFLAFGAFMFAILFVKIMKDELLSINSMASDGKSRRDMYKKLSEFIQLHANLKQIINTFSDLCETLLTLFFGACIITICVAMLLVQIQITRNETYSMVVMEAAVFGAWALLLLLFADELGQRFSNAFEEINDVIIHLDWYLFPCVVQRVLPTVMQSTQKPTVIKCFGNVLCARKQFRKVVKTVYSYFMALREFYK